VFRAFQGIGGAGIYALGLVIIIELFPPEKYAAATSLVSAVFAISLLLGPILSGAINKSEQWRWIFLLK
jgi:MFS family permease